MIATFQDNVALIIYALLWIILIISLKNRLKRFNLTWALISIYSFMALVCFYLYNSRFAYLFFEKGLSLLGFIYLFIMLLIALYPIIKINEDNVKGIWIPTPKLISACCIICSLLAICSIITILPKLHEGILIMLSGSDDIVELYEESKSERMDTKSFSGSINFLGIFSNIADYFLPLLLFLYLLNKNKNKIVLVLLILGILKGPLQGIANASRFQLISQLYVITLMYFFFKPYLNLDLVKSIKRYFLVISSFFIIIFITISLVRSDSDNRCTPEYGIARYYAQGPIVFNNFCLDANGTREGHFTFPLILHILGEKSMTENELRQKYYFMKVDNSKFTTFVGDYVLDFGPIVAFFLFVLFSMIACAWLRNNGTLSFSQLIILYLSVRFCCGFYQYQLGVTSGNIFILTSFLIALLFMGNKNIQVYIHRISQ